MNLGPRPAPRPAHRPAHRLARLVPAVVGATVVTALAVGGSSGADAAVAPAARTASSSTTSTGQLPRPWGHYTSKYDDSYGAYLKASGHDKDLLGKIALRPKVRWFGSWIPNGQIVGKIRSYISTSQGGNKNALVSLAVFRLWPHNGEAGKNIPLSLDDRNSYRQFIRGVATAVGSTRTAIVLEPDLAVSLGGYKPETREALTKYAAQTLAANKNTSVYIDGSDADWLSVDKSVSMLKSSGVSYARGFALGATHYDTVSHNTHYAAQVVAGLAKAGIKGKHAVLDTADNGKGFTYSHYYSEHPKGDFDNAEVCTSKSDTTCDTLGHPPTPYIPASSESGNIDGYLWFGRPWLYRQNSPFKTDRALGLAATTPY